MARLRVMIGAVGWPGHAFPALALARDLHQHDHEVLVETFERWRGVVESMGIGFAAADEQMVFGGLRHHVAGGPTLGGAARSLMRTIAAFRPDVVVSDLFTLTPALAAEAAGVLRATLVPHPYPVVPPGLPFFTWGVFPPRSPLGARVWRASRRLTDRWLEGGRRDLNQARAELGLAPYERPYGAISDGLALVATFPQLEFPRRWPAHVHVTGPMLFEVPHPEVELPRADLPLVVVAASTAQDPELKMVRTALAALEDQPVSVLVTLNRQGLNWAEPVPRNAVVVDWVSYTQVMPQAALVISSGGHGTVVRALAEGTPVLVCPWGGDMAANGVRVAWAGAGLMLPRRLLRPGPMRWSVRRLLADEASRVRAERIADWGRSNDAGARATALLERYVLDATR
jgi:UDP:flavonoid glycosyltransferase YjiC (YdhE family)